MLNEGDGDMCVCGTWHQYGNHNGGWAAMDFQDPTHGCQNAAADDSLFCLYCQAEPDQECDQWGRVVPRQNLHVHPQRGYLMGHMDGCSAPTRCYDVWPGMVCPTCRYETRQSCFMRCRCPCNGCSVGPVWYTPDSAELCTYDEPPPSPYADQGDMEEQVDNMDDEWEVYHELLQDQDNFGPTAGEGEAGGPTEDAVAPTCTAQDATPTTSAVVVAAVDVA